VTDSLFEAVPGFDQPIAVLKHCHDRIRKQLRTMHNLLTHLPEHGADVDAQQAAKAVLQYFSKAAPKHHDDEEQDLLPMLQAVAQGDDAALLRSLCPEIMREHQQMDAAWQTLNQQLQQIACGAAAQLSAADVQHFAAMYTAHMETEESHIAPMAKRLFSAREMAQLGAAMQNRRGIISVGSAVESAVGSAAATALTTPVKNARIAHLRTDYSHASLTESDVLNDPIAQFAKWFDEALKAEVREPNAMSVATVAAGGRPSSRIVLVKDFDQRGFTWFTNYDSRKGRELQQNPYAALLFHWPELERQVRIEGRVERISAAESDAYFNSRPLKSRLGAIASDQSAPVADRAQLETRYAQAAAQYGEHPPRPEQWGGYRLVPDAIEFWQGRPSRLHDRIFFTLLADGSWLRQRLQP